MKRGPRHDHKHKRRLCSVDGCNDPVWKPAAWKCLAHLSRPHLELAQRMARAEKSGRNCVTCFGMSWRRPRDRACDCGGVYADDDWRAEL